MQNNLAPVSQTDCHNSQSSPTLNRCKDPEKRRRMSWNEGTKRPKKEEKKKKKWSSLERSWFYLVSFGLFLRSVLKGTVRTSFLKRIQINNLTNRREMGLKIGNVINSGLSFQHSMKRGGGVGGGARSENIKLLFNQQPDMTDGNAVPRGKRARPPESPPSD